MVSDCASQQIRSRAANLWFTVGEAKTEFEFIDKLEHDGAFHATSSKEDIFRISPPWQLQAENVGL